MVSVIPFLVPFELAYTFLSLGGEHVEHALSRSNRWRINNVVPNPFGNLFGVVYIPLVD